MPVVVNALSDKNSAVLVEQPTPTAPVLSTTTDLKLGDTIRLVWAGGGTFYNVYFKKTIDAIFIKANPSPLGGATTQYDVGGLLVGVSYDFTVRGVNGIGTESANSNILSATPTIDLTLPKFSSPTWSVKINGSTEPRAVLNSVELGFGSDTSNAIFVIHDDPDTGSFPTYNDNVEVIVNGKSVLIGKIKGITSRINLSGLTKTFTAISGVTRFQEKVVATDNSTFNAERGTENVNANKLKADAILQRILGFIPAGTPTEFPGEIHVEDQTLLAATEGVLRKLGNFKIFYNKNTDQLEAYKFGQGGDVTRQFIKGTNIIDFSITENRQDVVDKLTIIGLPRALRQRTFVGDITREPGEDGIHRAAFTLTGTNIRDIYVEGTEQGQPTIIESELELYPEDMGIPVNPSTGFAEWPSFPLADIFGSAQGDPGFRHHITKNDPGPTANITIGTSIVYPTPNSATVFIGAVPRIYKATTIGAFVDSKKVGVIALAPPVSPGFGSGIGSGLDISGFGPTGFTSGFEGFGPSGLDLSGFGPTGFVSGFSFEGFGLKIPVTVLTSIAWARGPIRAFFTVDGLRPTVTTGSGVVERTITDSQYQILNNPFVIPAFNNEAEILALMQKRLTAEFARLNKPRISGTITVIGDETIDLKSTVLVSGQQLDVVKVVHNFTSGFTTQVALTNEPFIAAIVVAEPTETRINESERIATTDFRIQFQDYKVDKDVVTQRREEFQKRVNIASGRFATYQD